MRLRAALRLRRQRGRGPRQSGTGKAEESRLPPQNGVYSCESFEMQLFSDRCCRIAQVRSPSDVGKCREKKVFTLPPLHCQTGRDALPFPLSNSAAELKLAASLRNFAILKDEIGLETHQLQGKNCSKSSKLTPLTPLLWWD